VTQATAAPAPAAPTGKLLALDVGLARIGVAVCDGLQLTVRPLTVVHRHSRNADFALLAQLVREQDAQAIICGLPINDDGSEGPQAQTTRKWAMRLAQALRAINGAPLPVVYWDERFTTYAAQELLAAGDLPKQQAAIGEDAIAAAVLLQGYLDAMRRGETQHYGRIDLPPRPGKELVDGNE
jgi:putative Holliday junction resolvase